MNDAPSTDSVASRLVKACVGGALIGFAAWLMARNLSLSTHSGFIFWVPITLWLLTMGVLCLAGAILGHRDSIQARWRVGWIVGGFGLAIGFVGPLIISPKSNLGPLLGILLTGPAGFVLGALGAGVVRAARAE